MRNRKQKILIIIALGFFPSVAFAADLSTILTNLRSLIGPLMTLLLIISYTAGIFMVIRAISLFKSFGSAQARPGEMIGPLVYLIVGTVLIYLPSTTDIVSHTIFKSVTSQSVVVAGNIKLSAVGKASDRLLNYAPVTIESQWADMVNTIVLYVQFIGFLAFVRGWFIISHAGQPGAQPGTIPKGITHIIGGIVAVNFLPMVDALNNTVFGGS
jgi:hypothetical protein